MKGLLKNLLKFPEKLKICPEFWNFFDFFAGRIKPWSNRATKKVLKYLDEFESDVYEDQVPNEDRFLTSRSGKSVH